MLIVGGAIAIGQFFNARVLHLQFVNIIQQEGKHTISRWLDPVLENINNTQGIGIYVVAFAEFGRQASVIIMDPADKIIVNKNINPPIAIEPFSVSFQGRYN